MMSNGPAGPINSTATNLVPVSLEKIKEYREKCYEKHQQHTRDARASNQWHSFLEILGVVLSASLSFSVVVLTAMRADNTTVAITSGVFSFFISVSQRIQNSYNFLSLEVKHHVVADNFYELYWALDSLDPNDVHQYDLIINKFVLVSQKHTQPVKECRFFCCFK